VEFCCGLHCGLRKRNLDFGHNSNLVVEAPDDAGGNLPLCPEPVQQQFFMGT
jgi:hypothetical protein